MDVNGIVLAWVGVGEADIAELQAGVFNWEGIGGPV